MPQFLEHSMTSWKGQELEHAHSIIDSIDPRARIIAACLFSIIVVFSENLIALIFALAISFFIATSANLNLKRTLRRVVAMDLFIVAMIIMLPFTMPGEVLFYVFGWPASAEGFFKAIAIALKANAVILMLLALVGTLDATTLGHALGRLHVPEKLVHLLLFTVRYLEVISREYKRMRKAMKARAFVPRSNLHTWRSVGYLVGMLLVRSLERSERILAAMKCRGYSGKLYLIDNMAWRNRDSLVMILILLFALIMLGIHYR